MKQLSLCAALLAGLFGISVAALASGVVRLPLLALPTPTGAYTVGITQAQLESGTKVTLWYPATADARGRYATYRPDETPGSLRERIIRGLLRTSAFVDVPVDPRQHPLLIYAPGWGQTRTDNTAQAQNLASHGFIVVGLDDLFPARRFDLSSESAFRSSLRWANEKVRLQAALVSRTISGLEAYTAGNVAGSVIRHMDFKRVGAFGFSFGGAVAAEAAVRDPRIRAAVDLDGWTFGDAAASGVAKPFFVVGTGAPAVSGNLTPDLLRASQLGFYESELDRRNTREIYSGLQLHGGYNLGVDGTTHESFCDIAVMPRLKGQPAGRIDGRRAQRITAAYVQQFFDRFINGARVPLFEPPPHAMKRETRQGDDPAAHLTIWNPSES